MGTLWQDLRFGLRMLAKNPAFTAVAVLTLALGIGANAAIFSVIYGVLLRPLPYPKPDQIVQVWEVNADGVRVRFAEPNFEDIRNSAQSFEGLAEYWSDVFSIAGGSESTRSIGAVVSRDFFSVLSVSPVLGRGFTAEDAHEGATPVLLVSYGYWQQYLGGLRDFSRLKLLAHNQVFSVVGVLPPGFNFPDGAD
ncbi:MAG: hypothetical protein DMG33_17870, partial [Acidobacteria bacterium]